MARACSWSVINDISRWHMPPAFPARGQNGGTSAAGVSYLITYEVLRCAVARTRRYAACDNRLPPSSRKPCPSRRRNRSRVLEQCPHRACAVSLLSGAWKSRTHLGVHPGEQAQQPLQRGGSPGLRGERGYMYASRDAEQRPLALALRVAAVPKFVAVGASRELAGVLPSPSLVAADGGGSRSHRSHGSNQRPVP